MTEKLYYKDSHLFAFEAKLLECRELKEGYALILDKTAFFPEGGGQSADTGSIGNIRIHDVREKNGEILHLSREPAEAGQTYVCALDAEQRLRRMQSHSGEHIVSGITHTLFGLDNVGFHMGEEGMTIDFNGELTQQQLELIEKKANEAVRANLPVKCFFPERAELGTLEYRSKLELTEDVRIVEIEGIDRCACCAPHVKNTGEIGLIKLIEHMRHRGGIRLSLVCGMDALDHVNMIQQGAFAVSRLLSAKRGEIAAAVERLLSEQAKAKERIAALSLELARQKAAAAEIRGGNACVFDELLDEVALRELVNMLVKNCGGIAGAFSGNDNEGYRYIIGSEHTDLRARSRELNEGIGGRGGGSPEMIQGRATKSAAEIETFVYNWNV